MHRHHTLLGQLAEPPGSNPGDLGSNPRRGTGGSSPSMSGIAKTVRGAHDNPANHSVRRTMRAAGTGVVLSSGGPAHHYAGDVVERNSLQNCETGFDSSHPCWAVGWMVAGSHPGVGSTPRTRTAPTPR